ncbi:tRNA (adenosine(37)-N6)-threonylcarbamoyltransferase complex dimerization subunit type 1 TsaB [Nonomuraea sp. MG754425]|uniref:tRNA (adenosine(37)-N6)-threonylcarbamoyltransferase complex dimerization subunit type 1 TsaB n=1 Tax=Nonomuraea sp. MG754425 TaxID=2570319 RepID=UPI001F0017EF|nr:tRNA (adenosine(37)-N6)-threonylcarbamoyltransferase complex dimerization subunit type 1 TsaB [Nonomuraea sp. MG754425]MCF6469789.1 tRNA (adenosine(37)-N6)-threonylcarbamoyltransferase complex dimerization subunit type 1 TsaB [Nonomuraea sp. MG754425]
MLVLAFDTATPAVTAALHDGERVLAESTTIDARRHGELLVPTIEVVLSEAGVRLREVTAIVAGSGPGPYTGLRVGLMTAQGLATTLGVPAYGICTLDAVAYGSGLSEPFLAATDARRKEVFWARYADRRTRVEGPFVDRPADVPVRGLPVVGAGAQLYPDLLGGGPDLPPYPYAGALAALAAERLGEGVPLDPPRPIYLRRPDAVVPGAPKRVTA